MQRSCLVCKKLTDDANTKKSIIKDGRLKIKSLCAICGNKKWSSSLDKLVINYKHGQKQ